LNMLVDVIMLAADLAPLFEGDDGLPDRMRRYGDDVKSAVAAVEEARESVGVLQHVILMQNFNAMGVGLNMDADGLSRVICEYGLLAISNYHDLFSPNDAPEEGETIHAIGISALDLDRYEFVQRLLHRAYVRLLRSEGVSVREVDVNKMSDVAQQALGRNVGLFRDFYEREVEQEKARGIPESAIVPNLRQKLDDEMSGAAEDMQLFMGDVRMPLPEKRAALAMLLGEDDELIRGYNYNDNQSTIDDLIKEPVQEFISDNNALLNMDADIPTYIDGMPVEMPAEFQSYASLSRDGETVHLLDEEIRKARKSMLDSTNFIRQKTKELEGVEESKRIAAESEKTLSDSGFVFKGVRYRLFSGDVEQRLLEDDFVVKSPTSVKSVDLRSDFTQVKDQGDTGQCSVYACVAIYEYIVKKATHRGLDLSEGFVYENLVRTGDVGEGGGASFYDAIKSMMGQGVCLEDLYSGGEPSGEAVADAGTRKIIEAKNVKIRLDDLKTALAMGYPVAVSLKIGEDFGADGSIISLPSCSLDECGHHALVLCGYSDEDRLFVVRNSWGTEFGEGGYCYIPYRYVTKPGYVTGAFIITKVTGIEASLSDDTMVKVSFDMTNAEIKSGIIRNLIADEQDRLAVVREEYKRLQVQNTSIVQNLGIQSNRDEIMRGTDKRLEWEKGRLLRYSGQMEADRLHAMEEMKHSRRCVVAVAGTSWLTILAYFGLRFWWDRFDFFSERFTVILVVFVLLSVLSLVFWMPWWKHQMVEKDEEFKDALKKMAIMIAARDKRLEEHRLRKHVAGMFLDSVDRMKKKLVEKYYGMRSYIENLEVWLEQEDGICRHEMQESRPPFSTVLTDAALDMYFANDAQGLTADIHLSELFRNSYEVSESAIVRFKNSLKSQLVEALFASLQGFSIYDYVVSGTKYPYVEGTDGSSLIRGLDVQSNLFVRLENEYRDGSEPSKMLFLCRKPGEGWDGGAAFSVRPQIHDGGTAFKMVMFQVANFKPSSISILQDFPKA